jgi:D-glycero-D-manno-heptose 1,7-bisphosphate phosphatase
VGKHEVSAADSDSRPAAIFLDRDGVINRAVVREGKPYPPASIDEFVLLEGVVEACGLLKRAGFLLVVVTNQPDVARGTQSIQAVEKMHSAMCEALPIDRVEVCYDADDSTGSNRRKPGPGMLLDAARTLNVDLSRSIMIGDRWRDIDCGHAAGCTTVFIDYGYNEELRAQPDMRAASLLDAARIIVRTAKTENEAIWQTV